MSIIWDCVCTLPDSYGYLKTVRLSLYLIEFFDYQSFQIIFQSDFFLSTSESLLNHGNLYSISHRKNYLKQVFAYDNHQYTFYEHLTVHRVLTCNFHTLRGVYGTDVLLATANSFTGSVLKADYTPKMADSMIMPNGLMSRQRTMTGAELKGLVRAYVEGCEGGFVPFNRGSLPIVSGIAVEVKEASGSYTLTGITRNGQPLLFICEWNDKDPCGKMDAGGWKV